MTNQHGIFTESGVIQWFKPQAVYFVTAQKRNQNGVVDSSRIPMTTVYSISQFEFFANEKKRKIVNKAKRRKKAASLQHTEDDS